MSPYLSSMTCALRGRFPWISPATGLSRSATEPTPSIATSSASRFERPCPSTDDSDATARKFAERGVTSPIEDTLWGLFIALSDPDEDGFICYRQAAPSA